MKEDSFTKLAAYFHNLAKHNPGTVTHMKTDGDDRFEFLYVAVGCSVSIIILYLFFNIYFGVFE